MLTNNAKAALVVNLVSSNVIRCKLPVVDGQGNTWYAYSSRWPLEKTYTLRDNLNTEGIVVGRGSTAPTVNDYRLESIITSGLIASSTTSSSVDENQVCRLHIDLLLTNVSTSPITVSEIGWSSGMDVGTAPNINSASRRYFLMDRTVLDTPLTIAAGDSEILRYTFTLEA